jgi:hypothetical protein
MQLYNLSVLGFNWAVKLWRALYCHFYFATPFSIVQTACWFVVSSFISPQLLPQLSLPLQNSIFNFRCYNFHRSNVRITYPSPPGLGYITAPNCLIGGPGRKLTSNFFLFIFLCPYCLPLLCFLVLFSFQISVAHIILLHDYKCGLHISRLFCFVKFPTAILRVIWNANNNRWIGKQSEGCNGNLITTSLLQNSFLPTGTRTVYARSSQSVTAISIDHGSLNEFGVNYMSCGLARFTNAISVQSLVFVIYL